MGGAIGSVALLRTPPSCLPNLLPQSSPARDQGRERIEFPDPVSDQTGIAIKELKIGTSVSFSAYHAAGIGQVKPTGNA
jgi:hypothetical protein